MDRLPLELLHAICQYLDASDVGNFRLLSKTFAAVGTQYLLPQIHTLFHPESLQRLESISKHPVYSQYVTSLFHEGGTLSKFYTVEDWECHINIRPQREETPELPPDTSSDREKRAYMRALRKANLDSRRHYSSKELAEGWENHERLLNMQTVLRATDSDEKLLQQAMSRLPRLRSISCCTDNYGRGGTPAMERLFGSGFMLPTADVGHEEYNGYGFFTKLLLGVDFANTKLEVLSADLVDWRFLATEDSVFARIKNSARQLKTLALNLSTSDENWDFEEGHEYLETGRLREFLAAAPDLTELDVRFDRCEEYHGYMAELSMIVRGFTWPNLVSVELHNVMASEQELLEFFERHVGTLKQVVLHDLTLSDGTWISTLKQMRQTLSLTEFDVSGGLRDSGTWYPWTLQTQHDGEPKKPSAREALREYVLKGDRDCPLLDSEFVDCYRD